MVYGHSGSGIVGMNPAYIMTAIATQIAWTYLPAQASLFLLLQDI